MNTCKTFSSSGKFQSNTFLIESIAHLLCYHWIPWPWKWWFSCQKKSSMLFRSWDIGENLSHGSHFV